GELRQLVEEEDAVVPGGAANTTRDHGEELPGAPERGPPGLARRGSEPSPCIGIVTRSWRSGEMATAPVPLWAQEMSPYHRGPTGAGVLALALVAVLLGLVLSATAASRASPQHGH